MKTAENLEELFKKQKSRFNSNDLTNVITEVVSDYIYHAEGTSTKNISLNVTTLLEVIRFFQELENINTALENS